MTTGPDELDQLVKQIDAEINAAGPLFTGEQITELDAQLQQLIDDMPPLDLDMP